MCHEVYTVGVRTCGHSVAWDGGGWYRVVLSSFKASSALMCLWICAARVDALPLLLLPIAYVQVCGASRMYTAAGSNCLMLDDVNPRRQGPKVRA